MTQILQQGGYQVSSEMNGREGLKRVVIERPHCLILDVILPEMNGYEICRHLRANVMFKQLPILMVSTKKTSVDANWALRQGVSRYLPKPFKQEDLLTAIQELASGQAHSRVPFMEKPAESTVNPGKRQIGGAFLQTLIPQRIQDKDLLWANGPHNAVITDRLARRVYNIIDGRSNLERLCLIGQLSLEQMREVVRVLVGLQRIQLYTASGQKVDSTLLLREL
jgi:CheY-like chemotaxis protein